MELNTQAMGIPSHRGGGAHGHLALVMTAAEYLTLTNIAFTVPIHPGVNPPPLPNGTAVQITENNRIHQAAIVDHEVYHKTDRMLKALLIKAVPPPFIQQLSDLRFGFAQVPTATILEHLDKTYGTVTNTDLKANIANMELQWNGDQPIETLWSQIAHAIQYAHGHDNISDKQAVRSAEDNIQRSGLFNDEYKEWSKKPIADQTLANLTQHFNQANRIRLMTATTANAGYSATTKPPTNDNKENTMRSDILTGWKYCWSHGVNVTHDGNNCLYPKDNHIKPATLNNPQGGSAHIVFPKPNTRNRNRRQSAAPPTVV